MSLLPFLLELDRSRRICDQHYGLDPLAMIPEEILTLPPQQILRNYLQPWKQAATNFRKSESTLKAYKDKFQVNLDVQHFAPEEIAVKTVDGYLVVEGKHEEKRDDHGWISRSFTRRYALPEGCDVGNVQSQLSTDGVLTVIAPLEMPQVSNVRVVPIIHTGPVRTTPEGSGEDVSVKSSVENGPKMELA